MIMSTQAPGVVDIFELKILVCVSTNKKFYWNWYFFLNFKLTNLEKNKIKLKKS